MLGFAVNPMIGMWERNAVLNGGNSYYVTGKVEGTLSIKTVLNGTGYWVTDNHRYRVDAGTYLVLNQGREYGVDIRSRDIVETFCLFFRPGFAEGIADSLSLKNEELLDGKTTHNTFGFYERIHPEDETISPLIWDLRRMLLRGQESD